MSNWLIPRLSELYIPLDYGQAAILIRLTISFVSAERNIAAMFLVAR